MPMIGGASARRGFSMSRTCSGGRGRHILLRYRSLRARRFKESKEVAEPEADPERGQRTVFAFQIALKADERDVYDFFSRAGKSLNACSRTGTVTSIPGALLPPVLTPAAPVGVPPLLLAPTLTLVPPVVPAAAEPVDIVGIPTECLLLKNLFDPTVETQPDFDFKDVETECCKHGTVRHIFVDKNSAGHLCPL